MSIIFSKVIVSVDEKAVDFLVSGIPREYDDLAGWTAFDNFVQDIKDESDVNVHVEAYKYGEGELYVATLFEVADFQKRLDHRPYFLKSSCEKIENIDFNFSWPSDEYISEHFTFVEM